ncbi:hypothetical protein HID58_046452 [Brassica napus]|uniref:SMP domain-containing protein n=1 Tax=Brassica napus TaxID=3708 RepID=A0ABQ8AWK6_BRANA|nr:hypothetical protein HID58_046452 [Brassica napus]
MNEAQMAKSIIRVGLTDATLAPNVNTCTVNTDVYLDGASFTNISVEEHFRVSQSNHGGQVPQKNFPRRLMPLSGGKEDENKIHLRDIIAEIDVKITRDRSVTSEDAEAVVQAELTHPPYNHIIPGGVAESVTAAYRLNRSPSL